MHKDSIVSQKQEKKKHSKDPNISIDLRISLDFSLSWKFHFLFLLSFPGLGIDVLSAFSSNITRKKSHTSVRAKQWHPQANKIPTRSFRSYQIALVATWKSASVASSWSPEACPHKGHHSHLLVVQQPRATHTGSKMNLMGEKTVLGRIASDPWIFQFPSPFQRASHIHCFVRLFPVTPEIFQLGTRTQAQEADTLSGTNLLHSSTRSNSLWMWSAYGKSFSWVYFFVPKFF